MADTGDHRVDIQVLKYEAKKIREKVEELIKEKPQTQNAVDEMAQNPSKKKMVENAQRKYHYARPDLFQAELNLECHRAVQHAKPEIRRLVGGSAGLKSLAKNDEWAKQARSAIVNLLQWLTLMGWLRFAQGPLSDDKYLLRKHFRREMCEGHTVHGIKALVYVTYEDLQFTPPGS
ncbi:MAG: hypothetical protein Q9220_001835 [cf. Caloplaca sp. 1 TL-2023]